MARTDKALDTAESSANIYDLVVIGTGQGGSAPITKCRQAGWRVAVIDDEPFGGTCALRGCDPKKVLVGAADLVAWQQRMKDHGVAGESRIAWPALMRFKESFTESVPANRESTLEQLGIVTLHGQARFISRGRLAVGDRELRTKHVVVAAGAKPQRLDIPGEELLCSSTEFLDLPDLPRHIVFVGAGYISFEFAHIAARAGAIVTMIARKPLSEFDRTLVDRLVGHTREIGIDVRLDTDVVGIERIRSGGSFRVACTKDGVRSSVDADLVVHGAGRVPATANLDVGRGAVQVDERGAIVVNEYMQSVTNPLVYAAGDVTLPPGKRPLTPVAAHEGAIVASNLVRGNTKRPNYLGTPSVVFTIPPLASVGLTEHEARALGVDVDIKSEDTAAWYSNRRTRTPVGTFKTIVDAASGRLLGAHLLGDRADEAINLFGLAIRLGIPAAELKHAIYAYPTTGSDLPYML